MFALNTLDWFSPVAFGLTVVPATMLLLAYEARLAIRGLGGSAADPRRSGGGSCGRRPGRSGGSLRDVRPRTALANVSKPPEGFEPPGTEIFDYTKNCLIGSGDYCITKVSFWMLMSAVIIGAIFIVAFRNPKLVPRGHAERGGVAGRASSATAS